MRRAVLAAALTASVRGYVSTLERVEPSTAGLEVLVLEGDDRLGLRNETGTEVVVPGYDGEPYLRFTPTAVYRNARSPATYLNEERFGAVELPAAASAKARPDWEQVADRGYEWHDHRIHWMRPIAPPKVRAAPGDPHHASTGGSRWRSTGSRWRSAAASTTTRRPRAASGRS